MFKGIAFLMENKKLEGSFMDYANTIDSLVWFLGYDFPRYKNMRVLSG